MRFIIPLLCLLSFVLAQQVNNTIFQLLNRTNGPAPLFAKFLLSSPDYKPIVDILNNPKSNVTVFVPGQGLLYNLTEQLGLNKTNSTSRGRTSSTRAASGTHRATSAHGTATRAATSLPSSFGLPNFLSVLSSAALPTNHANYIKIPIVEQKSSNNYFIHVNPLPQVYNLIDTQNTSSNATNITTSPFASNFTVLDLLYYHVINGSQTLHNDTTAIFDSLLTNHTVNMFGSGSPVLVHPNSEGNLTVGNGLGYDANITRHFNASNGAIYIIDKVMVPPVNVTETLTAVQNASIFQSLLEQQLNSSNTTTTGNSNSTSGTNDPTTTGTSIFQILLDQSNSTIDALNATNITMFVPSNDAFDNIDVTNMDNQTINNLIQAHIFKGVYYSTNLTSDSPMSIESDSGSNVTLEESPDNGFTVNGTNVTQPNILLNNGVMHLIDGILEYPNADQPSDSNSTESEGGILPIPTESNSDTGIASDPTDSYTVISPTGSDNGMSPTDSDYGMSPTDSDYGMSPTESDYGMSPTESDNGMSPTDVGTTPTGDDGTTPTQSDDGILPSLNSASMPTVASTLIILTSTFFFYFLYV